VAECDGLEALPSGHEIGSASRLAPGLRGRAGDKLQGQISSVAVSRGSFSKSDLHLFEKLLPLRFRKTNDQPDEARKLGISVARFQAHARQKIHADHLQAVASRLVAPKH
jgi:hypothetical protein